MNATPEDAQQHHQRNTSNIRSRPYEQRLYHAGGGRGRYNKKFCLAQRHAPQFAPNKDFPTPFHRTSQLYRDTTPLSISGSSVTMRPWSPIKGRILAWDDV